jgi:hypothetical protein
MSERTKTSMHFVARFIIDYQLKRQLTDTRWTYQYVWHFYRMFRSGIVNYSSPPSASLSLRSRHHLLLRTSLPSLIYQLTSFTKIYHILQQWNKPVPIVESWNTVFTGMEIWCAVCFSPVESVWEEQTTFIYNVLYLFSHSRPPVHSNTFLL